MSSGWAPMTRWVARAIAAISSLAATVASAQPARAPQPHTLWVLTASHTLLQVRADALQKVVQRRPLQGLEPGESVLGMDFRVARGVLYAVTDRNRLLQGSHEDASPFVSPDLGGLTVVGPLGTGPLADAAFDIADVDNATFAAVRAEASGAPTRLLRVDLGRGSAQDLGPLGDGEAVRGLAIEP